MLIAISKMYFHNDCPFFVNIITTVGSDPIEFFKIVSNDKLIVSYRNGQYSVTTDEQYIAKKREDTAKVLCFSYFDNMFALGFSKDEAIRFIQDYSERLKIQTNLG